MPGIYSPDIQPPIKSNSNAAKNGKRPVCPVAQQRKPVFISSDKQNKCGKHKGKGNPAAQNTQRTCEIKEMPIHRHNTPEHIREKFQEYAFFDRVHILYSIKKQ
jgi:hypothetical protein